MSEERDELAERIAGRLLVDLGATTMDADAHDAAHNIAALLTEELGYRKPQQVTTPEELAALPNGTILLSNGRYPRYKWTLWRVKTGGMIEQVGHELKGVTPFRYFKDPLPATVLHVGGAE